MPFYVLKGDLVEMNVDAIVNAANVNLKMVEGVGRAIYHKAGDKKLALACNQIGHCDTGKAVVTESFDLTNCKYIIHAVGPIYVNGKHEEEKNLISAYNSSFQILSEKGGHSIAFPLLSGEFSYPLKDCYEVAYKTILKYTKAHLNDKVYLVMYKNFPETIDDGFQEKLTNFVTSNYRSSVNREIIEPVKSNASFVKLLNKFQKKISDEDLAFYSDLTLNYIKKLKTETALIPSKPIVFALAIALKLDENELNKFLKELNYTFGSNQLLDLIVSYYIRNELYDIYKLNNALFNYNLSIIKE